jgi:Lar family restriction alleviation protein
MSDELKPCPFCGETVQVQPCGHADRTGFPYSWFIECDCGISIERGYSHNDLSDITRQSVIDMWNRRPQKWEWFTANRPQEEK